MTPTGIKKLLGEVASGRLAVTDAIDRLRHLPFEDLGFARIDQHRHLRRGLPEIVFGQGKTPDQCARIVEKISGAGHTVLVTRANPEQYERIRRDHPRAEWHEVARAITLTPGRRPSPRTRAVRDPSPGKTSSW
jgi:NCAIR mutase (PurE)-related protein